MKPSDFSHDAAGKLLVIGNNAWAFDPDPLPPKIEWSNKLVATIARAERAVGLLRGHCNWLPNPTLFSQAFLNREAVLSSKIEDSSADLMDVVAFEIQKQNASDGPRVSQIEEVYNYALAIERGQQLLKTLPISRRLINELHFVLLDGVRGQQCPAGEFRKTQTMIGNKSDSPLTARFVPVPPGQKLESAMDNLEHFINGETSLPALIEIALAHYQFETIHPYVDGNGRIGRLLISLMLIEREVLSEPLLYLSGFFERNRHRYQQMLLGVSQSGNWESWLTFFLEAVESEALDAISRSTMLQELRENYRWQIQASSAGKSLLAVDYLFSEPVFSVATLSKAINVPVRAARSIVSRLLSAGMAREITGKVRNRLFKAEKIIDILERAYV